MKITIYHYQFHISEPYQEGHPLSAAEARALNNLRAENIRNNTSRLVTQRGVLSLEELERIQGEISQYDQGYQFGLAVRGPKISALDRMILEVAEEYFPQDVETAKTSPSVQVEARRRLEERRAVAERSLEELLG